MTARKYEALIACIAISFTMFISYKSMILSNNNYIILKPYVNSNIMSNLLPKQINKKCGTKSIIFIFYLPSIETSRKIENICNIFEETHQQ